MLTASLLVTLLIAYVALVRRRWRGGRVHDLLTGLATRDVLARGITDCATRAVWREEYRFAVLVLEIDRAGAIRDSVGHFGVEDAFADTAERLSLCTRSNDLVARIADRRFGVLLDDVTDAAGADRATQRLLSELEEVCTLGGRRLRTTPATGIAISGEWRLPPEELIARAEASLREPTLPAGH